MARRPIGWIGVGIILVLSAPSAWGGSPAAPAAAPASDPEPSPRPGTTDDYPHRSVVGRPFGVGARSYWLFEPAAPKPRRAPVVVFNHGWLAMNPGLYGAWIEHLARSGCVVIYPRYQADWRTEPSEFLPNALEAVLDALDVLQTAPGSVRPDLDRFALIGHSAGGSLAAQMAAVATSAGLPTPRAVVALMPGQVWPVRQTDLAHIPAETLLMVVAAENDPVVGDARARQIFVETTAVPPEHKAFVLYRAPRGAGGKLKGPLPPLPSLASHLAPTAALAKFDTGEGPFRELQMAYAAITDDPQRKGFWRLADLTLEAAFAGQTLRDAIQARVPFDDDSSPSRFTAQTDAVKPPDPDTDESSTSPLLLRRALIRPISRVDARP